MTQQIFTVPGIRRRGARIEALRPMHHNLSWGKLRRGGVRQYVQGQGVSHIFVRMTPCCRAGRYVRNLFARGRGQSGAHDCRGVCALGVARGRADAPQFVMGARFGEAAWAQCARGPGAFSRGRILPGCLGGLNFRILAARNRDRSGVHDGRGVFALGDRQ